MEMRDGKFPRFQKIVTVPFISSTLRLGLILMMQLLTEPQSLSHITSLMMHLCFCLKKNLCSLSVDSGRVGDHEMLTSAFEAVGGIWCALWSKAYVYLMWPAVWMCKSTALLTSPAFVVCPSDSHKDGHALGGESSSQIDIKNVRVLVQSLVTYSDEMSEDFYGHV